jgi:hypothetical protein
MATVHVALARVTGHGYAGFVPVAGSVTIGSDTVTTSGTSAVSTLTGQVDQVWSVTARDGDVWIKFGPDTPVAAAEDGWLVVAGQTREFSVSAAAEKLAIKDA